MKMYLNRTRTRQDTTDGVLFSQQRMRICDTAEHTPTRLPAGTYKVVIKVHPGKKHRALCLLSTDENKKAAGFLINGNGVHKKGFGSTIIVGEHLIPGVVLNSRTHFEKLFRRVELTILRKKEVELIIR